MSKRTVALLGVLVLSAFTAGQLTQPLFALESPTPVISPAATRRVATPSARLSNQAVHRDDATAQPTGMTFEVDDAVLTAQLNTWVAGRSLGETPLGTATAQELAVQLREDQVIITGTAQAGRLRLPVELAATAAVQSGHVQVHLRGAQLGGVSVPEQVRRGFEQRLQDQVDQTLRSYPVSVQSVRIGQGKLTIVGTLS